jgi:subtilisin family serine protease
VRRFVLLGLLAALCASASAAAAPGRIADEPLQGQEWWLQHIDATQAPPPGPGVPIAIVDVGVDPTHPEFAGRPNTTFLNDQTVSGAEEWHGTEVASIAAAPANGVGLLGLYPQAALEVFDASASAGSGLQELPAVTGIETIAQHCPAVINLSFGTSGDDPALADAILTAVHNGCLVVAASGNDGESGRIAYPAAYPHVLAVGATDTSDQVAPFSSVGPWVGLVAPGVQMIGAVPLSHDPSGYSTGLIGTSFSAPLVAAAAAWIWTARPGLDASQVYELLRRSARPIGGSGYNTHAGWGLLDVGAALTAPVPPRDSAEPNDDIDQVKPGELFPLGKPTLTTTARASNRISGSLLAYEDPRDLYRIWVPAHRVVRVSVASGGAAAARIWGPQTASVGEPLADRRRDLKGTVVRAGNVGFAAYVEVLLTGRSNVAQYVLSVQSSTR